MIHGEFKSQNQIVLKLLYFYINKQIDRRELGKTSLSSRLNDCLALIIHKTIKEYIFKSNTIERAPPYSK